MEYCETNSNQNLAQFVRTHEKALANALQLRRQGAKNGQSSLLGGDASPISTTTQQGLASAPSTSNALAAALSLGTLNFASQNIKPAKLTLTPHHLFYLLSCFEDLGIVIGPMNVRLENLHADSSPANYVSFLSQSQRSKGRSERDSVHSVSSVRSVMTGMSALWSNFGIGSSNKAAKTEKAKAQLKGDLKYLYSSFTKIPCLRLSPNRKARLIGGYEEFPFDTAVPLLAFKNVSALEICDVDFRQFFGWDRLAEQLRSLLVKRANVEDPTDLLIGVVLDDMDKRRKRSSKSQSSPVLAWPPSPSLRHGDLGRANSSPGSPKVEDKLSQSASPRSHILLRGDSDGAKSHHRPRTKSTSPSRPTSSRQDTSYRHGRSGGNKTKRSGSVSSTSSTQSNGPQRVASSSNLLSMGILPASKWRFLRHLSLADNSMTSMTASGLAPLADTLHSMDLSSNLFSEIPDCLATLTALRALNLSNCMIESLHSLKRNPLPAITALNLRANRLTSIAGVERLLSLERLDLRDNRIPDPTEMARLSGIPDIHEIWVASNPFVKTHGNHRVTIFNIFRSTPGYSEDVIIDASGPGYSERRQLRDRVIEPEGVLVVKPSHVDMVLDHSPETRKSTSIDTVDDGVAKFEKQPRSQAAPGDITMGSNRRRKGPRRRIVDLSKDESPPVVYPRQPAENPSPILSTTMIDSPHDTSCIGSHPRKPHSPHEPQDRVHQLAEAQWHKPEITRSQSAVPPALSDNVPSLASDLQNPAFNGEAYRRRVEALKNEVGSNWLSVLSEEGWDGQRRSETFSPDFSHVSVTRPGLPSLRGSSQGIVSGSRTLG